MGGQACVFYGAAEFSRDIDLHLLLNKETLANFNSFIKLIQADVIAVPDFEIKYLEKGHAIHFRAMANDISGLRIDIMSKIRGLDDFEKVWERRTIIELSDGTPVNIMGLEDLVLAKKTQRDKDWPMIRRLVESHYFQKQSLNEISENDINFWFKELRTPSILIQLSAEYPKILEKILKDRPLLKFAKNNKALKLEESLKEEESIERKLDTEYWKPLKLELEKLRHKKKEN